MFRYSEREKKNGYMFEDILLFMVEEQRYVEWMLFREFHKRRCDLRVVFRMAQ